MNLLNEIYESSKIPKDLDFEKTNTNYVVTNFVSESSLLTSSSDMRIKNILKNKEEKDLKMELKKSNFVEDNTQNIDIYIFSSKINTLIETRFLKNKFSFILFIYLHDIQVLDNIHMGNTNVKLLVFYEFAKLLGYKIEKIKNKYKVPFLITKQKKNHFPGVQFLLSNIVLERENVELLVIDDTLTIVDEINYGIPFDLVIPVDKIYFKDFVKLISEILENKHKFNWKYKKFYLLYEKLHLNTNNIIVLTKNKITYNYFVFRRKLDNFYVYTLNEISNYNFSLLYVD